MMRTYLLIAEDPFYTVPWLDRVADAPIQIVGAAFPKGFINTKRILPTLLIYGPIRFALTVVQVLWSGMRGGRVENWLKERSIPVKHIENVNSPEFIEFLKSEKIDLLISNNCPQRLKSGILSTAKLGAINQHLGKLPAYRGVFPIFHAIANGEKEFGISIHYMDEEFDNGPILVQKTFPIGEKDTIFSLYPPAFKIGAEAVVEAVHKIQENITETLPNGPQGKSYFSYPDWRSILRYHFRRPSPQLDLVHQ